MTSATSRMTYFYGLFCVFAIVCVGCGAPPELPAQTGGVVDAPSSGVEHREEFFEGARGVKLYAQWWRPRTGTPRGALVVVHGLRDYSARYGELAERLAKDGIAVYAADLRGHAHSAGKRVSIQTFDDYLDDLDILVRRTQQREPHTPVYLFGFSMGGAIAADYAITYHPDLQGLILAGAALDTDASGLKIASTKAVSSINPDAGLFSLDPHDFSRDPQVVDLNLHDPLVYQDGAPVHTAVELLAAIDTIQARMHEIDLPILVLHGKEDKVVPMRGSVALYAAAKSTDKTLTLYDGLYHDLLHEPEKLRVEGDIEKWLLAHLDKKAISTPVAPAQASSVSSASAPSSSSAPSAPPAPSASSAPPSNASSAPAAKKTQ
jgi:acylglycerol lipase